MAISTKRNGSLEKLTVDKYFNLIEHAADGIAILQDGVFKLVNTALARISGYNKEELLGMPITKLLTPESQKLAMARYQARLAGKEVPSIYEIKAVTKDGEARDIEINATLTEYEGRVADEVIVRDITERKQTEHNLGERVKELHCLYGFANIAERPGVTLDEMCREVANLLPPAWQYPEVTCARVTINGKELKTENYRETEWKQSSDIKVGGEKAGIVEVSYLKERPGSDEGPFLKEERLLIDTVAERLGRIIERKQAEEQLRASEDKLKTYLESAPDGVYINDLKGTFLYGNKKAEEITGYKREELIGQSFLKLNLLPAKYLTKAGRLLALNTMGKHTGPDELELIRKDGSRVWVEITTAPIKQEGKTVVLGFVRDITERKQAKETIHQQNEFLGNVLNSLTHPFYVLDANDYTVKMSNLAAEVDNLSENPTCYSLTHKSVKPCGGVDHVCPLEEVKRTKKPAVVEHIHYDEDGNARNVEVHGYPIFDTEGNVVQMIEYCLDITGRKRAEEALADEVIQRRILVDQSRDGIVILDQDGKVYEANQRFAEMLGYSPEEVTQLHVWDWDTQWTHEQLLEMIQSIDTAGDQFQTYHRRKDGTVYDVEISTNGAVCAGQKLVFCVCRDITERKRMETKLREADERYRTIFESANDMLVLIDKKGKILDVNKTVEDIGGYRREEIAGKNIRFLAKMMTKKSLAIVLKNFLKRMVGMSIPPYEIQMIKKNGELINVEVNAVALRKDGRIVGDLAIMRDITEKKQAEEREKQLQQELNLSSRLASIGQMASGIAHEINNPLTAIIGFSQLLMNKDIPEDIKADLVVVNSEAQRVAKIVGSLLTFARQHKPGREYMDINDIISGVLELRSYSLKVNNIQVVTQLAFDLPRTMADGNQLQQVFLNIITNAEKEMIGAHNGGKLLVKTEKKGKSIRLFFTDDGPGISRENLNKIFDPFFTTREVGDGTGLGLSICHSIIAQHNGKIRCKSELGEGATFVIELPIVADSKPAERPEVIGEEPWQHRGAKILVVDDEAATLDFLKRLLTEQGYDVETTDRANIALEKLQSDKYDLILLDIKLPGMSGIELYHHMKAIDPALAERVIFISGDVMETTTRDFLDKTKASHIVKPINIEQLKKESNRILTKGIERQRT